MKSYFMLSLPNLTLLDEDVEEALDTEGAGAWLTLVLRERFHQLGVL